MRRPAHSGFNLLEALIILAVLAALAAFTLPYFSSGPIRAREVQTRLISQMKQLHLATQQMALDGVTTGDTGPGWPGDTGGTFAAWASNLITGNYLTTNDLCRLLSAPGQPTWPGTLFPSNNHAVLVYAVRSNSPPSTVFLSTADLINTPQGWTTNTNSLLFQRHYTAYFLTGGSAEPSRGPATNPPAYAPLCR